MRSELEKILIRFDEMKKPKEAEDTMDEFCIWKI